MPHDVRLRLCELCYVSLEVTLVEVAKLVESKQRVRQCWNYHATVFIIVGPRSSAATLRTQLSQLQWLFGAAGQEDSSEAWRLVFVGHRGARGVEDEVIGWREDGVSWFKITHPAWPDAMAVMSAFQDYECPDKQVQATHVDGIHM